MVTRSTLVLMLLFGLIAGAGPLVAEDTTALSGKLLLLAAASTTEAVDEVRAAFVKLHPEVTIRTSFGGSSALARQIEAGAEADLFLPASNQWARYLVEKHLVARQRNLLSNRLVVVVAADSKLEIRKPEDLLQTGVRRLALADPKSVPAGIYARQSLEALGLWKELQGRVAGAMDVRQALKFVDTGAAEAAIVYATDASVSKNSRIALPLDPKLAEPVHYPVVLLKHGAEQKAALALYDFFASPAALAIFRRHGFLVSDELESTSQPAAIKP
jgi:molybdate transport system substrate-binding protein